MLSIRNFSGQLSVVKTTDEDLNVSYTFTDKPATVTHTHAASGKTTRTEVHAYSYDHADRLLKVEHTLGGTNVTLAAYGYDNFGRLQSKSLHGSSTNKLTYAYNVRNWLTGISGSKFTQNLYYNTGNGTARYNGSISSMTWKAGNESTVRGYKFTYDGLDRLLNATYGETAGINANTDRFSENVTAYDKNGNIKTLQRYGQTAASGYGLIDNLTFTLAGNLLNRVDDAAAASAYGGGFEFKDGVKQANEYTYDSNGNLTKDLNKGISTITYNVLNLPNMVTFSDGSTIAYTYGADGTKLKTVHKTGSTTTTTDYCGNVVYENGVQKLLLTDEGYVTLSDSKYHYYLKDHQGNNRVVINQSGTVEETNHYYPFGGVFANTGNTQPYKYNGKEFDQELVSAGKLSPVFFGSALTNFGVETFLEHFLNMTTSPLPRRTTDGVIDPFRPDFSAFVFKIQANMNKAHRDRIAFMRICSGKFEAGMEVNHVQGGKKIRLTQPQQLMAESRKIIDEAYAGDIIGVFDPGIFSIGDTLCTSNEKFQFEGIPTFAPEHFARVRQIDTMKRKQFLKGVNQIAQEGAIQIFQEFNTGMEEIIVGVVGVLQFEV